VPNGAHEQSNVSGSAGSQQSIRGRILAVCTSKRKGTAKHAVGSCRVQAGFGLRGDAHAGVVVRQISALAQESIERMLSKLPGLKPGAFGENLVTAGIMWPSVPLGTRLRIGEDVVVLITQHGKVCHTRCAIFHAAGECIMPTDGVFLFALTSGEVKAGDPIRAEPDLEEHAALEVTALSAAAQGMTIAGGQSPGA
jgi:MOSC domain-containing protein YiiM